MNKKIIIGFFLTLSLVYGQNNSVELNINNDTLEAKGEYNLNQVYELNNDANYMFTVSYLRSEIKKDKTETILNTGLKIVNPYINDYGFNVGFGANAVWIDNSNTSFTALPISLYINYILQESLAIGASASYSPKILSFGDADTFTQYNVKANYKVIDNGYVYVGKRYIKTSYTNNVDIEFDDAVFFGFKVLF
jgi:hypothetical protein